jgi:hypothetical protein
MVERKVMKKVEQKREAIRSKMEAEHLSVEQAAEALGIKRATAFRIMRGIEVAGVQRGRHPKTEGMDTPEGSAPVVNLSRGDQPAPKLSATVARNSKPQVNVDHNNTVSSDELTRRREWECKKDAAQREQNFEINCAMGRPFGPTQADRDQRQRQKIANALGFDPCGGTTND